MRKNRTSPECVAKYLSLSNELCHYLPLRKSGIVDLVICSGVLGLVLNN